MVWIMFKINNKDTKGNTNEHFVLLFLELTLNKQVVAGRLYQKQHTQQTNTA